MARDDAPATEFPDAPGTASTVVTQTDGGMIPIVTPASDGDRRKGKTLLWREAKISLAHPAGGRTPTYAGCVEGGADEAGRRLLGCAVRAGFGSKSRVHAVGDGAPWIAAQVEERFGSQGSYLIDFFHVCEYLAPAAERIEPETRARDAWMAARKDELKTGCLDAVLAELASRIGPDEPERSPVRTCHRYLLDRAGQLDYRAALAADLPIGSGEIESAHRYVAQKRLKLPGARWLVGNAERMLALRINRLNGDWRRYWAALKSPSANDNRRTAAPARVA